MTVREFLDKGGRIDLILYSNKIHGRYSKDFNQYLDYEIDSVEIWTNEDQVDTDFTVSIYIVTVKEKK